MLMLAGIAIALYAFYMGLYQPAHNALKKAQNARSIRLHWVAWYNQNHRALDAALKAKKQLNHVHQNSSVAMRLATYRLKPYLEASMQEGDTTTRALHAAPLDAVLLFMQACEQSGQNITQIDLKKNTKPGTTDARITLNNPSSKG